MSEEVFDTKVVKIDPKNFVDAELSEAVSLIQKGDLVAFPTETVYGLGANALRYAASPHERQDAKTGSVYIILNFF